MTGPDEIVRPDKASLAREVAGRLLWVLSSLTSEGDRTAHVSLTGGSMGIGSLAAVAAHPDRDAVDWSRVHLWWSDERFVARDDDERNALQARRALGDAIDIPAANVHEPRAAGEGSLDDAARAYAEELREHAPEGAVAPRFDVCLLGVGPDAHIASLFPGRDEVHVDDATVLPVRESPKPPPERITFTLPVINGSARVWLVVAGSDKADAVAKVRAGAPLSDAPAAGARGDVETILFVDEAASA